MSNEKDNGQKTVEELAAERMERYKADPNAFVETKPEVILCVIRSPQGPMIYVGGNELELQVAYAKVNQMLLNTFNRMDVAKAKKQVQIANPGFMKGLRGMKR